MGRKILQLESSRLARGGFRDIFQHPEQDDLLIKVVRAASRTEAATERSGSLRRYGVYTPYLREMKEYLAAYVRCAGCPTHIQQCHGLVDTDRGLGMVVEKLSGPDGDLAPNLAKMLRVRGIDSRIWKLYEAFEAAVRKHQLVINDLHPSNIVLASGDGGERLVLVDGLGEKAFFPLRTLSRGFNRYKIERDLRYLEVRMKRMAAELHWPGRFDRRTAGRLRLEELIDRPPPA